MDFDNMQNINQKDFSPCNLCWRREDLSKAESKDLSVRKNLISAGAGIARYEERCNDIRKRKISNSPGLDLSTTRAAKKTKLSSPGEDFPKIAHIIWLSGESGGSAPSERMLNILSLCKQIKSEGWCVKLWTNKPIVIERAALGIGLSDESSYRGLQLETGTCFSYDNGKGDDNGIELCSDKELLDVLEGIDQESYKKSCNDQSYCDPDGGDEFERKRHLAEVHNKYELPLLWWPENAFTDQLEGHEKKIELSQLSPLSSDSGCSEGSCSSSVSGIEERSFCPEASSGKQPVTPGLFRKSLLHHYLSNSIGMFNYSAKCDNLRMAALEKFGGVYIDSDTVGSSVKDKSFRTNKKRFYSLSSKEGVILANGWQTGFCGDLLASKPGAWQVRHMLFDQFFWASYLDQLPYVLWLRDRKNIWCIRTVEISPEGLKVNQRDKVTLPYVPAGGGDKRLLTLRDASRFRGSFCRSIHGSSPARQKGAGLDHNIMPINEQKEGLRYLLTLHSPGPMTVGRMAESYYPGKAHNLAFDKVMKSRAQKMKDLKDRTVLSVTKWGELTRVATVSWDKPGIRSARSFEDGEALHLLLSLRDGDRSYGF